MINYSTFDIYCDDVVCYTFFRGDFMKRKLSQLTAPALAGVVKERNAQAAVKHMISFATIRISQWEQYLIGGKCNEKNKNRTNRNRT